MIDALRQNPDINTAYYDKEDALLVAVNFKNPPGRLLRRQWTYPMKVLPDFSTWRDFVQNGDCEFPAQQGEPCLDIEAHKVGMLRCRQKFSFPCDNSVIRVDKNYVAGRRFGSSCVCKDNFSFGIRERSSVFEDKVLGEDELINMDTRKDSDRRCTFWLEFENACRLSVDMLDDPEIEESLIPVYDNTLLEEQNKKTLDLNNTSELAADADLDGRESKQEGILKTSSSPSKTNLDAKRDSTNPSGDKVEFKEELEEDQDTVNELPTQAKPSAIIYDPYDKNKGACLTFTYKEGLIAKILPNGDIQ